MPVQTGLRENKGEKMPIFAVQRNLPGISMEELGNAQKAAIGTSDISQNKVPR